MASITSLSSRGSASSSATTKCDPLVCCNRCRKPLTTTIFACSCDCVFCEECSYHHFNTNSNCPSCSAVLAVDDLMELVVADPSATTSESYKSALQTMFTKFSPTSTAISQNELCSRFLKSMDDQRRVGKFLLKQIVTANINQQKHSGDLGRAYDSAKKEIAQLKQAVNNDRLKYQQVIGTLQHRLQAEQGKVQELQRNVDEKDKQVAQFRQILIKEGTNLSPSSSYSHSSGGQRGNAITGLMKHEPAKDLRTAPPPMQGYAIQRQARQQADEQALEAMKRGRLPVAATRPLNINQNSMITPIQIPDSSSGRHGSSFSTAGGAGSKRDFSSAGYQFTSLNKTATDIGGNKRHRSNPNSFFQQTEVDGRHHQSSRFPNPLHSFRS